MSLDATRGLTVAVMIFVDNTGDVLQGHINHSPWCARVCVAGPDGGVGSRTRFARDYVTFADFVMPFFIFMVGMSMSMSFAKYQCV